MAGSSFLPARSPVTPNSTSTHGPATLGILRSRGSRSGFDVMRLLPPGSSALRPGGHLGPDRAEQFVPRCLELLHALVLQHGYHVVVADAEALELLEYLPGLVVRAVDRVAADRAVGLGCVQRRLRHGV